MCFNRTWCLLSMTVLRWSVQTINTEIPPFLSVQRELKEVEKSTFLCISFYIVLHYTTHDFFQGIVIKLC